MNEERSRGKYTVEFKHEAVRQVKSGRAASAEVDPIPRTGMCLILRSSQVQGYPRRRSALATYRPTRWVKLAVTFRRSPKFTQLGRDCRGK